MSSTRHVRRVSRLLAACGLALLIPLAGCVYRMNIQQGNFLQKRDIDQLKVGMTPSQVRYLLGTPMVPPTFNDERWDYLYYFKRGRLHRAQEYLLTVYFTDGKVSRIDDHGKAAINSEPTPGVRAPRPVT